MGNKQTIFTADKFNSIKACTNFSRSKILSLYKRFRELDPQRIPATMLTQDALDITISQQILLSIPELNNNPFRDRILYIFSHDRINKPGQLCFLNFLEMFNFLDETTSKMQKMYYGSVKNKIKHKFGSRRKVGMHDFDFLQPVFDGTVRLQNFRL